MTKKIINVGSGELTGDGETIRSAFVKINENFDEVYAAVDTIPTNVSELTNDAGYISTATTPVSAFNNDAKYITTNTNVGDFINNVGYLTTASIPDILGNLEVTGGILQTITGTIANADITLSPKGTGGVSVPKLNIPVGTILGSSVPIIASIADLELDSVIDHSTGPSDALTAGQYGITNGIPAPWAVYQFTTSPSPVIEVDDVLGGAGIPASPSPSVILAVGTGTWSNTVIAYSDFSSLALPVPGAVVTVARATTHASMNIETNALTDVNLNVGPGGKVVTHASILPYDTNLVDLGSPAKRFRKLWLGGGTIYVLDETLGVDQAIGARDGLLYVSGGTGLTVGEFTFQNNQIRISDPTVDILFGSTTATGKVIFNRPITVNTPAGQSSFSVTKFGLTTINPPISIASTQSALTIVGNENGFSRERNFPDTLLFLAGKNGVNTRFNMDSFGSGNYSVIAARQANGTAENPTATLANDTILRLSTQGWGSTTYVSTIGRINVQATQNFTDSAAGTRVRFQLTPNNSIAIQTVTADITSDGLSFVGNSTGGITFRDSTRQITAWTGTVAYSNVTGLATVSTTGNYSNLINVPTNLNQFSNTTTNFITTASITWANVQNKPAFATVSTSGSYADLTGVPTNLSQFNNNVGYLTTAVTQLIAGVGLTVTTSTGVVGIDATGVQTVVGTPNRVIVTDSGSKNLTLTTPQDLATTSSVTFQNITVTGNINVVGTATIATNASVVGKIIYLASSATNATQINGGGIQLGTSTFARSILYAQDSGNDYWYTDPGTGFQTEHLNATTATFTDLNVSGNGHFGTAFSGYEFDNAAIQADGNVNNFMQIVIKNHSTGTSASSDFVASNNLGTDSANFIDMGINSSQYANPDYSITEANDGYVFVEGGSLAVGTASAGTEIRFHTGGTTTDELRATITDAGLTVVGKLNGLTLPNVSTTAGWVLSNNGSGVTSWVQPQTGYVGSQGVIGYTGSQGNLGYTGSRGTDGVIGYNGSIGYTGSQGSQGYAGSQGIQGVQGDAGYTGSKGIQGNLGFTGSIGFTGSTGVGYTGSKGDTGSQGNIGYTGSKGDTGAIGNTGATGYTGSTGTQGIIGYTGSKGDTGAIGNTGATGYTGSIGGIGYTGSAGVGYTGSAGIGYTGSASTATGFTGSQGNQGSPGYTGSAGVGYTGSQGTQGNLGYTGSQGNQGSPGYTGSQGVGYTGSFGSTGYTGSKGVADVYVSSISTGTGISVTTSTGAVTVSLNTATVMNQAVRLSAMSSILAGTLAMDPTTINKGVVATQTFTITGLTTSHKVIITPAAAMPDKDYFIKGAWASATNTLSVEIYNASGGNIDAASINVSYIAFV
jgi:hypothetical protein